MLADLERAARLLDTGLWSFNLLAQGARTRAQLREAASAAEDVRAQVVDALEQARAAWRELRGSERAAANHGERDGRDAAKRKRAEVKRESSEIKRAAKQAAKQSLREAHALAERAAYLAFRQALGERQEAIREHQAATITTRFPKKKKKEGTADGA